MRRLTYTPLAEADLLEIALYIADDSKRELQGSLSFRTHHPFGTTSAPD
jgi:plasmid stabilization system protein ParE